VRSSLAAAVSPTAAARPRTRSSLAAVVAPTVAAAVAPAAARYPSTIPAPTPGTTTSTTPKKVASTATIPKYFIGHKVAFNPASWAHIDTLLL
jgi:hypothetical protein